jgi:hypothetical protein
MGVKEWRASGGQSMRSLRSHIGMCSLNARDQGLPPAVRRRMVEGQSSFRVHS